MELVYLWVEEYKNIKNQGFNFSPRFKCDYNPETNELTIDENDDYIENFFGENINVTAIVGKNGSGKSSIKNILEQVYIDAYSGYLLLLNDESTLTVFSDRNNLCYQTIQPEKYSGTLPPLGLYWLQTYSSEMPYPFYSENKDFFNRNLAISFEEFHIYRLIKYTRLYDFELTSFMLVPYKAYINQDQKYIDLNLQEIRPISVPRSNNPNNGIPYKECQNEREHFYSDNALVVFMVNQFVQNGLFSSVCEEIFDPIDSSIDLDELERSYNNPEFELNSEGYSLSEYNELLSYKEFYIGDDSNKLHTLISKYHLFLSFDYEDRKGRKYSHLSHGEKSIFGQFINIVGDISNQMLVSRKILFLDEPGLSLHPQWQKNYMKELVTLCNKLELSFHIILTTHSPFLLSDIPKQNIIFLDTDENGNCKVVDGLKDKKETFGANIHTLLSDSFFMEDGLMGEFAKGKINEIIEFHNIVSEDRHKECLKKIYEKRKNRFWQTQSIIGEEYLKQIIKNHLVEIEKILLGKDKAKEEEIKRVEKYLESLKND